ncbi:hypothetical protein CLOSYM_00723 [[Clostridium] symbiosum ATCC 14940]|uniref:Uncharacterized protein n=1 Tax=[Clostridium] symbiosum ATCC 14940 TaxID=411472 RepID=A0ABC9U2G2_CLOSY|nr:hypothetical protein CLOSYM_00723 [[Clostridium] symbiosum ATCC 14940]
MEKISTASLTNYCNSYYTCRKKIDKVRTKEWMHDTQFTTK